MDQTRKSKCKQILLAACAAWIRRLVGEMTDGASGALLVSRLSQLEHALPGSQSVKRSVKKSVKRSDGYLRTPSQYTNAHVSTGSGPTVSALGAVSGERFAGRRADNRLTDY